VLWHYGGIYVDSDVEPLKPLTPLCALDGFAAWESTTVVPDAVLGARKEHPAIWECLVLAKQRGFLGAWESGPGVTTQVLPKRDDWLLLPPQSFYPYYFNEKQRAGENFAVLPWCFAVHRWAGSWL